MGLAAKIALITVGGIGTIVFGLGLFIGLSPVIRSVIKEQIKGQTKLEKQTEQYERWEHLPFPLQFNVYIFNVTNPEQVVDDGAKPRVQEIGPFIYKQYFQKKEIDYNKNNDTYSYKQYIKLEFDKENSPHSDEITLTVLNLPLQGVFQNEESGDLPAEIQSISVDLLWSEAFEGDGIFINITPRKLFFDGYKFCKFEEKKKAKEKEEEKEEEEEEEGDGELFDEILSSVTSLPKRIFCDQVKKVSASNPTIIADDEKVLFSFFKHKNNHADGRYEVLAGLKDIYHLGEIRHWENVEYLKIWNGSNSTCNAIRGTDSAIYPPFNNESSVFHIYNTDICKSITLKTTEIIRFKGIKGIKAIMGVENFSNEGEHSCYCIKKTRDLDGEFNCFPKGLVDMYNCLKAPVILSFPHLMWADERYRNSVDGLTPDENKHMSFVAMEPITGTPLQGRKRVQFNAIIRPLEDIKVTEELRPALVPVIWVEEIFDLPDELAEKLKHDFIEKMTALDVATFSFIGFGLAIITIAVTTTQFVKL